VDPLGAAATDKLQINTITVSDNLFSVLIVVPFIGR